MKRPSFQFYHGDWRSNAKLRRCTDSQRGIWLEVMCLMADGDEFGILRWPLKDISNAVPCRIAELRTLIERGVMKGADVAETCAQHLYTPRHAGRAGTAVVLIPEQPGPIWYSSRMVRDAYRASTRGKGTRFGDAPIDTPTQRQGGGPSASSSSSPSVKETPASAGEVPDGPPDCPHEQVIALYHELLPTCPRVAEWTDARQTLLRARWRQKAKPNGKAQGYASTEAGLAYWRRYFTYVAQSDFLTGKTDPKPGRPPFLASLEWLLKPSNFAKVVEGNFHR